MGKKLLQHHSKPQYRNDDVHMTAGLQIIMQREPTCINIHIYTQTSKHVCTCTNTHMHMHIYIRTSIYKWYQKYTSDI